MDNTKYIALSRQMGLWKQMDIVSNNMANMNTSGYKQDDAVFSSYLVKTENAAGFGKVPVYFTHDFGEFTDFAEGAFVQTGNTFDLALKGDGFFSIETDQGERYTKKGVIGRLKIAKFADNQKLLKIANTMFENVAGNAMQVNSGDASVAQGYVEKSNVEAIAEMTKMIKLQRSYEYVQQMIDEEHDRVSNTIAAYAQLA